MQNVQFQAILEFCQVQSWGCLHSSYSHYDLIDTVFQPTPKPTKHPILQLSSPFGFELTTTSHLFPITFFFPFHNFSIPQGTPNLSDTYNHTATRDAVPKLQTATSKITLFKLVPTTWKRWNCTTEWWMNSSWFECSQFLRFAARFAEWRFAQQDVEVGIRARDESQLLGGTMVGVNLQKPVKQLMKLNRIEWEWWKAPVLSRTIESIYFWHSAVSQEV